MIATRDVSRTPRRKRARAGQLVELCRSNSCGSVFVQPAVVEARVATEDEELADLVSPFFWRVSSLTEVQP